MFRSAFVIIFVFEACWGVSLVQAEEPANRERPIAVSQEQLGASVATLLGRGPDDAFL